MAWEVTVIFLLSDDLDLMGFVAAAAAADCWNNRIMYHLVDMCTRMAL